MKKMRWYMTSAIALLAVVALAWTARPLLANALQLGQGTATSETSLAGMSNLTSEQTGTSAESDAEAASSITAIVKPGGADLFDARDGAVIASLEAGTMVTATARMEDNAWYQVESAEVAGWVLSARVIASGAEGLPVISVFVAGVEESASEDTPTDMPTAEEAASESITATVALTPSAESVASAPVESLSVETPSVETLPAETAPDMSAKSLPTVPAVVRGSGATLVTSPGEVTGQSLRAGLLLDIVGVSEDGLWLAVEMVATPNATGWVEAQHLIYTSTTPLTATRDISGEGSPLSLVATIESTTVGNGRIAADAVMQETETVATSAVSAGSNGAMDGVSSNSVTVASGTANLNVRALPGTANAIVGKATSGAELALIGKTADGSWLQVLLNDGISGWVSSTYITGDTSAAPVMNEAINNATVSTTTSTAAADAGASAAATTASTASAVTTSATGLTGTIVYQTSPGGTFYAYNLATGAQWPLTSGWDPAISPDGQTVAFVRGGGENGLYLIDIDGSNERLIYGERRDLASPKWSPDGNWIVFGRGDSYVTCRQIGQQCLPDEVWLDRNPNLDLDKYPLVDEYLQRVATVDVDGNNYHDIATLDSAREPDWSSAGIVYASSDGLQLTDDSESAVNRVVYFEPLQARDQDPDWAGDRIVFVTRQSSHYQIFSVNPDGTGKTSLTKPVTTLVDQIPSNVAPAFSPDGSHIVFLSNRVEGNEAGDWHLWVMDADGSNQRMLETVAPITYDFNHMEQAVSWGT